MSSVHRVIDVSSGSRVGGYPSPQRVLMLVPEGSVLSIVAGAYDAVRGRAQLRKVVDCRSRGGSKTRNEVTHFPSGQGMTPESEGSESSIVDWWSGASILHGLMA